MHEPWRNTYAHLMAEMGWPRFAMNYAELELQRFLATKPRALLDSMIAARVNSPLASSCGRLFDAAAAAAGVCRERAFYEGQAAAEFEALVDRRTLVDEDDELAYPFAIPRLKPSGMPYIEPLAVWEALLGDLILATPVPVIAARFHKGLAIAIVRMVDKLCRRRSDEAEPFTTVALSGGVFDNRVLLEQVLERLAPLGLVVLSHRRVSAGDGGLSLGQAAVAAARLLAKEATPCALASRV
jgi:hydrogenase maturation protein HypF